MCSKKIVQSNVIAEKIINQSSENLKELIAVANIINSKDWDVAVLKKLEDELRLRHKEIDNKLNFEIMQNRYAEIFYENWGFWISVYYYKTHFSLWITDKSPENEISPKIKELGFGHYNVEGDYHHFNNPNMFEYAFPDDKAFSKLVEDILSLLKVSRKDEN